MNLVDKKNSVNKVQVERFDLKSSYTTRWTEVKGDVVYKVLGNKIVIPTTPFQDSR